jgi:Sec-independent protein translocase protein TatA
MLKKIGSWIGSIKRYFKALQDEVSIYENENFDVDDAKKKKDKVNKNEG